MTTIREGLSTMIAARAHARLKVLEELGAPKPLIENAVRVVNAPLSRKIDKLDQFGDWEFTAVSEHKGYGGKPYLRFRGNWSGGDVLYVIGQWGPYLYQQKEKS